MLILCNKKHKKNEKIKIERMLESKDLCFQSQSKCQLHIWKRHIQYNTILLVPLKTKKQHEAILRPLNKPLVHVTT